MTYSPNPETLASSRQSRSWKPWSDEEKTVLASLYEGGTKRTEIAERLGKSERAIQLQAVRMGLANRGYTMDGLDRSALEPVLIRLHSEFSNPEIARILGKHRSWVVAEFQRLGMTRDRSTVAKRRAGNLGYDLPPEVQELMQLRRTLLRKINAQSQRATPGAAHGN